MTSHRAYPLLRFLCLLSAVYVAAAVVPPGAYPGSVHDSKPTPSADQQRSRRRQSSPSVAFKPSVKPERKSWSSMLTVDPAKIMSHLVNRGGLVLSKDISRQIDICRKFLSVERAELNVVSKELILYNFTIGIDSSLPAVRIARTVLTWDSYLRPTLVIEVEDIHVLVEFTNLMLTENNWNELHAAGFPPILLQDEKEDAASPDAFDQEDSAFVRCQRIHFKGSCHVRVTSRPLGGKEIGTLVLEPKALRNLSHEIQKLSDNNLQRIGRAGCSPEELNRVIRLFFDQRVKQFVKARVEDLAKDPRATLRQAEDLASRVSGTVLDYVHHAGRFKGQELQQLAVERIKGWGIPNPSATLSAIKERALYGVEKLNVTAVRDHVSKEAASVLESLQVMRENLRKIDQRDDETEFVFADW